MSEKQSDSIPTAWPRARASEAIETRTNLLPSTYETPDAIAIRDESGARSWAALETRARRFAHALAALDLGPGRHWALLAHNRVEWAELVLGNMRAGSRYVPLNWHLTAGELDYLLRNSGASALIVDPENEERGRAAAAEAGLDPGRIFVLGPAFDAWLETFPDADSANQKAGAALLYTGGTTGASKGVIRSDSGGDIRRFVPNSNLWSSALYMPDEGSGLITTPLYHAYGAGVLNAFLARRHSVILKKRFDAEDFLATVAQERVSAAPLVPTLIVRLAKLDDAIWRRFNVSSLRWIGHTAAPCPAWAKQALINRVGPIVVEFYGSSEGTGPVVCTSAEWMARPGTVGKPNPRLEASVVDDQGNDLPPGAVGTLYFRRVDGPPEYFGDREKTDRSRLPDGRFTVGDLGSMDADGFIYLADRRVDLILMGGSNVYPAEIEAVLVQHAAVRDVAVFGVPHGELGEEVKAAVELQDGDAASAALAEELIAWCKARLASFKCPRSIDFHDALPREASGKLKKRLLRDPYWAGIER